MSADKINDKACGAELAEIISEVVKDKVSYFINQSWFSTISGEATEAKKWAMKKNWSF